MTKKLLYVFELSKAEHFSMFLQQKSSKFENSGARADLLLMKNSDRVFSLEEILYFYFSKSSYTKNDGGERAES